MLHDARDTTARQSATVELQSMQQRPSQYNVHNEVPEKSWAYRFAKRHFFNDFGAYEAPQNPLAKTNGFDRL